jgi:hypothetical protein
MLISDARLRQLLGSLWLLDGVLQLQPRLFTQALVTSVMRPTLQGQPAPIAATLNWIAMVAAAHAVAFNAAIACVQIALGLALITGYHARAALVASIPWAVLVWIGGEGLGMLLTGQASALTGAPGAVLLYALIALAIVPRMAMAPRLSALAGRLSAWRRPSDAAVVSREKLRVVLSGLWALAAVLQVQPIWWGQGQIAGAIAGGESPGLLAEAVLNPALARLAMLAAQHAVPLNLAIIVVCLALAAGLVMARTRASRCAFLAASVVCSLLLWIAMQAFGGVLTGLATDLNSGPLLVLIALGCWPASGNQCTATSVVRATFVRLYTAARVWLAGGVTVLAQLRDATGH